MRELANKIIKGRDNPVIVDCRFSGEFAENGLDNFNRIEVYVGDEVYSTDDADRVFKQSKTQLRVKVGEITNLADGRYELIIIGFTPVEYEDGYQFPVIFPVTVS